MTDYLRLIDTNTSGARCDVTPLFADPAAFAQLITDLAKPLSPSAIDYVAGVDALGFILGAAMAVRLEKGFIAIRKGGKLPVPATAAEFADYTGRRKVLEIRRGILKAGDRVLIVDEWIETGAQVQAAIELIEAAGGEVAGIATINMDSNPLPSRLREEYRCHALWHDMR